MSPDTKDTVRSRLRAMVIEDPERTRRLNALHAEILRLLSEYDAEQTRYGAAASAKEDALCCPVTYDPASLAHVPQRVLDVDYGCGDPTVYAEPGQTVLDLGSGSGKHAFMIARKVGPEGRVIGIDKTPEMLALARGAVDEVMANLGYESANVSFRRGHIDSLGIDFDHLEGWLAENEISGYDDLEQLERSLASNPLVPNGSVDLVVSNCVLNLVQDERKRRLLQELYRVVKRTGSVAISDIVADREVTEEMKRDPELWTGCISGAWRRDRFMEELARAGFHGVTEVKSSFWKRVEGINFFSVTVRAWKGKQGPCYETYRSAMYRGPFSKVVDDDEHIFARGEFVPVCDKTAELLARDPYLEHFHVTPRLESPDSKLPFDCGPLGRHRELDSRQRDRLDSLIDDGACCEGDDCC